MKFFNKKIEFIRKEIKDNASQLQWGYSNTDTIVYTADTANIQNSFSRFDEITLEGLLQRVNGIKQTTCLLDPLPGKLIKELFVLLGPSVLNIINLSLSSGTVPVAFKKAVIHPLLKRPNLDPDLMVNYRPVSHLPFISKILEKIVAEQLNEHLAFNNLCETFQSGFRANHSTETALAKLTNDLLLTMDSDASSMLLLLDLSAAFDTVDHNILLERIKIRIGISDSALSWFNSYLTDRMQCVSYNSVTSDYVKVTCGVPQGSVLGPVLFSIYMLPLGDVIRKYGISFHCYADDTQLYMPLKLTNTPDCSQLEACLNEIKQWMSANFLQLNAKKTEMLIIGPARHRPLFNNTTLTFDNQIIKQGDSVKNLGIIFDPTLSFESHIKSVTKTAFFHLRNIAKIRSILSTKDAEIIIHAFVTSRLDYCNVLFSGLPMSSIKRLQLVQNAAARLLTRTRKFDHITPVLAHLHWLPVHLRCDFTVLLLTYKILHGLAPAYLADCIVPYVPARNLRSKDSGLLVIPRAQKKSAGYRAFSVRAPVLWNALPVTVRDATSVEAFKSHLKTHLYTLAFK
ncbi:probable RNA-directed DNA polymerase from transposon BS isoform X1 [Nerophis ophidion]|uniref:probable RNA-directed DNA polymerase from transposon BS isoform X1 n=1 Tax=Nerophis ophidion TaxID=159077 RepID=UPI002ADF40A4|nr:probable RNA-directed DNA polymerase from transposon BS isoform X1 [Nerophis ophidion]